MIRVACWTCALLALATAYIYERCELARELQSLGVVREHISTWVCIAYHESRLDTSARNHYSGDHGLFQISELYWCGPGKVCGIPCSALRDEDISDDVECALRVHEEHTRLQGNGFLAWVVYPQSCKHNTKKYIVDCDSHLKEDTVRSRMKSRTVNSYVRNVSFEYNQNIDNLKPPYLTINSIIRGGFGKMLQASNYQKSTNGPINWLNLKIDNIDQLTLPVLGKKSGPFTTPQTTTTTTPITIWSTYAPIKVWRRIESNQFRKKLVTNDKKTTPSKWSELGKSKQVDFVSSTPKINASYYDRTTSKPTTAVAWTTEATTVAKPTTDATTVAKIPTTTTAITSSPIVRVQTTTARPLFFSTTINHATVKTKTKIPVVTSVYYKPFTYFAHTTGKPSTLTSSSQKPTTRESNYDRPATRSPSTTSKQIYESIISKSFATTNTPVTFTSRILILKPTTTVSGTRGIREPFKQITFTSTPKNRLNLNQVSSTTARTFTTTEAPGFQGINSFKTSRSWDENFTSTSNTRPFSTSHLFLTATSRSVTSLPTKSAITQRAMTTPAFKSIITQSTSTTKSWQSIFDLYLKPTQRPTLRTQIFPVFSNNAYKLKIFSGGTTTPVPLDTASRNPSTALTG